MMNTYNNILFKITYSYMYKKLIKIQHTHGTQLSLCLCYESNPGEKYACMRYADYRTVPGGYYPHMERRQLYFETSLQFQIENDSSEVGCNWT